MGFAFYNNLRFSSIITHILCHMPVMNRWSCLRMGFFKCGQSFPITKVKCEHVFNQLGVQNSFFYWVRSNEDIQANQSNKFILVDIRRLPIQEFLFLIQVTKRFYSQCILLQFIGFCSSMQFDIRLHPILFLRVIMTNFVI